MDSPWSTGQLPKGTSFLTHSALRASHRMLVGCSIQVEYETIAHDSTTRKGAAITIRRRRRLRLTASGGTFPPEPGPDRRRPLIASRPSLVRRVSPLALRGDDRHPRAAAIHVDHAAMDECSLVTGQIDSR